jgi:glucose/mannose transport system substrate-binding protein
VRKHDGVFVYLRSDGQVIGKTAHTRPQAGEAISQGGLFMQLKLIAGAVAASFGLAAGALAADKSVEVLHWWTSGGEAAALNVLKQNLEKQGVKWNDMPVAGGGGEQAMTALRARVTAGNPPTAVQMLGFDIQDWGKQGVVADLNAVAAKEGWDKVVPSALQRFSKYNGKWIASPVNVHSTNWVWANKEVLAKAGVKTEPKTWDEFIAAAEKVQKAGLIGIAHGGQPWQDATIFDGVALSTGGVDYYRKAFIDLDQKALTSATTEKGVHAHGSGA